MKIIYVVKFMMNQPVLQSNIVSRFSRSVQVTFNVHIK